MFPRSTIIFILLIFTHGTTLLFGEGNDRLLSRRRPLLNAARVIRGCIFYAGIRASRLRSFLLRNLAIRCLGRGIIASMKLNALASGLVSLAIFGLASAVYGMATEQIGPDRDQPTVAQPDWPRKIENVPRHGSRVYSIWVNGNENFYFHANLAQANELLALFSKARLRDHEVWIKRGPKQVESFGKQAIAYNAHLQVVAGLARLMGSHESSEPQLTVYVDDTLPAGKLVFPTNLILHDDTGEVSNKTGAVTPRRDSWYGRVQFEDGGAAVGPGVNIRVSLWQREQVDEIKLAAVDREGLFSARFSELELADLKNGKSWLTITVGNWLTEASKSDPQFPVARLGDKDSAQVVKVPGPKYYYGRILFEDGTSPKLDPAPWPGARIRVDFSYAGSAEPDEEGYFKVFFTKAQFDKVQAGKPQKNVYIPDRLENGRSTARVAYPPSLLSQDKAQAGVVKIPRP